MKRIFITQRSWFRSWPCKYIPVRFSLAFRKGIFKARWWTGESLIFMPRVEEIHDVEIFTTVPGHTEWTCEEHPRCSTAAPSPVMCNGRAHGQQRLRACETTAAPSMRGHDAWQLRACTVTAVAPSKRDHSGGGERGTWVTTVVAPSARGHNNGSERAWQRWQIGSSQRTGTWPLPTSVQWRKC